ncbi:hypothetical protein D3C71_1599200 [compost metagenome]
MHINGGDGALGKGRQARGKVEKWVEPLVPDSPPQRASESTGIGPVGCNERSELHRLFGLGGEARQERGWPKRERR